MPEMPTQTELSGWLSGSTATFRSPGRQGFAFSETTLVEGSNAEPKGLDWAESAGISAKTVMTSSNTQVADRNARPLEYFKALVVRTRGNNPQSC